MTDGATYRISVHETADKGFTQPEYGTQAGWVLVETKVPLFGLRTLIRNLRDEDYPDESILIECE